MSPWGWGRGGPMFFGGRMCFVFLSVWFCFTLFVVFFFLGQCFFVIDFYSVLFRKGKEGNDFH